jgi:hypothetical protein
MNIFIPNCPQRTRNGLSRENPDSSNPNVDKKRRLQQEREGNSNTRSSLPSTCHNSISYLASENYGTPNTLSSRVTTDRVTRGLYKRGKTEERGAAREEQQVLVYTISTIAHRVPTRDGVQRVFPVVPLNFR